MPTVRGRRTPARMAFSSASGRGHGRNATPAIPAGRLDGSHHERSSRLKAGAETGTTARCPLAPRGTAYGITRLHVPNALNGFPPTGRRCRSDAPLRRYVRHTDAWRLSRGRRYGCRQRQSDRALNGVVKPLLPPDTLLIVPEPTTDPFTSTSTSTSKFVPTSSLVLSPSQMLAGASAVNRGRVR